MAFSTSFACICTTYIATNISSHTHTQNGFHQISSSLFFRVSFFLLLYFDAAGFCVCRSKKLDGILVDFAMCALLMRK